MRFTVEIRDGVLLVSLLADLTFDWFMEFDEQIRQALAPQVTHGILDLSRAHHLDSSGLGVIARLHRDLKARGGGLILAGVVPPIDNLLQMVGFHHHLRMYPTLEEALATLRLAPRTPQN
ncbi:MAG: hypothetical protein OZSIB_2521 [Candidatus Ozemobacter sibiricus]|uniref:Anti-sigma factor antagonist n=1 Tax=Candidatus Ozemobacter sibiricus TaxID=2268124 RepID=A0A367ZSL8_9BACT|nr:MAG: hypothetical protein OZSIB_2521 [Candidatus Ozemobacter sibiricus]